MRKQLFFIGIILLVLVSCKAKTVEDDASVKDELTEVTESFVQEPSVKEDESKSTLDAQTITLLDTGIEELRKSLEIPGIAVGMMEKGGVVYAKGFGTTEVSGKEPVTPQTLFNLSGSMPFEEDESPLSISSDDIKKLGMSSTSTEPKGNIAKPHGRHIERGRVVIAKGAAEKASDGHDLWSNIDDILKYLKETPKPSGFTEDDIREMSALVYDHEGGGYQTLIAVFPERELSLVLLANTDSAFLRAFCSKVFDVLLKQDLTDEILSEIIGDLKSADSIRSLNHDLSELQYEPLIAKYHHEKWGDIAIRLDGDKIIFDAGTWQSRLVWHTNYDPALDKDIVIKSAKDKKKIKPEQVVFEADDGKMIRVNDGLEWSFMLADPPISGTKITPKYDKKKVIGIGVDHYGEDILFNRVNE